MKLSLLISTYNWPEALALCLETVRRQTVQPYEILIADDGSGEDTKKVISAFEKTYSGSVKHIWHEDKGFRLAKIRNKALEACEADYVVQIDGDILMHPSFIEDHQSFAKKGSFVVGSRSCLPPSFTQSLLKSQQLPSITKLRVKANNFFNSLRIPFIMHLMENYHTSGKYRYYAKGCNMAFWLHDLLEVNGYDEAFEGWGKEDSDLVIRLRKKGTQLRRIKMGGVQFHLYHKFNDRSHEQRNDELMYKNLAAKHYKVANGIKKLSIV